MVQYKPKGRLNRQVNQLMEKARIQADVHEIPMPMPKRTRAKKDRSITKRPVVAPTTFTPNVTDLKKVGRKTKNRYETDLVILRAIIFGFVLLTVVVTMLTKDSWVDRIGLATGYSFMVFVMMSVYVTSQLRK